MVRATFRAKENKEHKVTVTAVSLSRAQEIAESVMDEPVYLECPLDTSFFAGDAPEDFLVQD